MTMKRAEEISSGLTNFAFCSGCGLLVSGYFWIEWLGKVFGLLSIISFLIGLGLLLRYPDLFAMKSKKNLEKQGLDQKYVSMEGPLILPGCMAVVWLVSWGNAVNWWEPVIAAVIPAAVLGVLFWKMLDYYQQYPKNLAGAVLAVAFALTGLIWQVNVILDFAQPEYVQVEVLGTGKSNSRKGPDTYFFETEFNGEERRICVSVSEFRELPFLEEVTIAIHSGGLGMEYLELVLTP